MYRWRIGWINIVQIWRFTSGSPYSKMFQYCRFWDSFIQKLQPKYVHLLHLQQHSQGAVIKLSFRRSHITHLVVSHSSNIVPCFFFFFYSLQVKLNMFDKKQKSKKEQIPNLWKAMCFKMKLKLMLCFYFPACRLHYPKNMMGQEGDGWHC